MSVTYVLTVREHSVHRAETLVQIMLMSGSVTCYLFRLALMWKEIVNENNMVFLTDDFHVVNG